jgi:hypothetical protein
LFLTFDTQSYDPYGYLYYWECPASGYKVADIAKHYGYDRYPDNIALGPWSPFKRDEEEE